MGGWRLLEPYVVPVFLVAIGAFVGANLRYGVGLVVDSSLLSTTNPRRGAAYVVATMRCSLLAVAAAAVVVAVV